jgi:large subunit ribosomal protein L6
MKVPEGVSFDVSPGAMKASGPKGIVEKRFDSKTVIVALTNGEVEVTAAVREKKSVHAAVNSVKAHINNMFNGVTKGFEKKLSVVYAHFPVTVEVKGEEVHVKNFLGEKSVRKARVIAGVKVVVQKQDITVSGADRDAVGQTAANIIRATVITKRDRRIFQDGIYEVVA